jgi:hypothetical protein
MIDLHIDRSEAATSPFRRVHTDELILRGCTFLLSPNLA